MPQKQLSQSSSFELLMAVERGKLDEQIQALTERRDSIDELLGTYQVTEGLLFEEEAEPQKRKPSRKKTAKRTPVTRDKEGALDKIRALMINSKGRQLSKEEIWGGVKQMYGVELPPSWEQMLYRRVRKGKTFYKTDDGKFGLLEQRARVETVVRIPETATA